MKTKEERADEYASQVGVSKRVLANLWIGNRLFDSVTAIVRAAFFDGITASRDLNDLARECHTANAKWWHDTQGNRLQRNKGELLCLIHSEISEAMEGERKGLADDKLPHRLMAEVELADALIRIFDYAGAFGYDLQGAFDEKMQFNATRDDHTHEARAQAAGKKW